MNQAIQLNDDFNYQTFNNSIQLDATVNGELITCYIGPIQPERAEQFYEANKFDIEEYCIELLKREKWNEKCELNIAIKDIPIPI